MAAILWFGLWYCDFIGVFGDGVMVLQVIYGNIW